MLIINILIRVIRIRLFMKVELIKKEEAVVVDAVARYFDLFFIMYIRYNVFMIYMITNLIL